MNPGNLRSIVAAPMASLFLILALCAFAMQRPVSQGIVVPMIRLHHDPNEPTDCGGRAEFFRLTRDGKTWVNSEQVPLKKIRASAATLMKNRAERVIYVVVDSELAYRDFAGFLDRIEGAVPDLHIVLVSGEVRRAFEEDHDLCDFQFLLLPSHP